MLEFGAGHEFELNNTAVPTEVVDHADCWGGLKTVFDIKCWEGYLTGARYRLERVVVPGGQGNHIGPTNAVHFRHTLARVPWGDYTKPLDDLWNVPIEAPDLIKSVKVLCAPTGLFGPDTRMRAVAIGGSGPREHVSLEEGPIKAVLPWLKTSFRTTFPGQSTVPGALYFDPVDQSWVWIVVRHPDIGGEIEYREDGQSFRFLPYRDMKVHDLLCLPDVSIYYGKGLEEADRCMANFFDLYQEPPAWWYNTCWFWLHTFWQPDMNFEKAREGVKLLMDDCGVKGFGLSIHDLPLAGADCEARSRKASPHLGGDDGARQLVDFIHNRGGHTYMWMARYGKLGAGGPTLWRDNWAMKGIDERAVGNNVFRICDALSPGYRQDMHKWIDYTINDLGITGIFWDSAFQPYPPNFSAASKDWLNFPGEAIAGPSSLYEEIYRLGKKHNPDFFMWGEGISTERVSNAFAVDNPTHGERSGHELMHRLAHAGPRRLVWRSCWTQDVSGAFPFIKPQADLHRTLESGFYRDVAADPMNRWLCQAVAQRGCRQARGIADGIAVLDDIVVVPDHKALWKTVVVPTELARGTGLKNLLSGAEVKGRECAGGVEFAIDAAGPWQMV